MVVFGCLGTFVLHRSTVIYDGVGFSCKGFPALSSEFSDTS